MENKYVIVLVTNGANCKEFCDLINAGWWIDRADICKDFILYILKK